MASYSPEEIGFIDETSKDCQSVGHRYGRSVRNRRAAKKQPFVRGRRVSATGLLTLDGIAARTTVEGSMTKELFLEYLENKVVGSTFCSSCHFSTGWQNPAASTVYSLSRSLQCLGYGQCMHSPRNWDPGALWSIRWVIALFQNTVFILWLRVPFRGNSFFYPWASAI